MFPRSFKGEPPADAIFWQPSQNFNYLTILLKYRFGVDEFPRQLNTNINGVGLNLN